MTSAIVVGGGIIGAATAFRLAERGVQVTLLEANTIASGTSSTSFAWMNSNNKSPESYHRLNVAGMHAHRALRDEFGEAPWLVTEGNLIWDESAFAADANAEIDVPVKSETLDAKIARLQGWDYPLEVLGREDIARRLPELRLPETLHRALFFPSEGYLDVPFLIASLLQRASALGATIREHTPVAGFVRAGSRVTGVMTASGERVEADHVIIASGRWTDQVTALLGEDVTIPMSPTRGLLVTTSKVASTLRSLVHTPRVNIRRDGGSRFLLANFDIDALLTPETTPTELATLSDRVLRAAQEIFPALASATVATQVVGIRSIPAASFPAVGTLPDTEGVYVIATHSGVTMGPLLGQLGTRELLDGTREDLLAPFRPERLIAH